MHWKPFEVPGVSSQGMKNPTPRIQMLDGFNQGWIKFEGGEAGSEKGSTELVTVLKGLVEKQKPGMREGGCLLTAPGASLRNFLVTP
jgi:hypothetical protein